MPKSRKKPTPPSKSVRPIKVFEVTEGGTLQMADWVEPAIRADFYKEEARDWSRSRSPKALAHAMYNCWPLASAVYNIYSDFRDRLAAEVLAAQQSGSGTGRRLTALKARLRALPEEPEDGAAAWLLRLSRSEFRALIVPKIDQWFSEPPDWVDEDEDLPDTGTARGAALEFFDHMAPDERETLGVEVVEGEHPGSTYFAAELRGDVDQANRAAEAAGIPVRFVVSGDS